jgi:hypothetical protein
VSELPIALTEVVPLESRPRALARSERSVPAALLPAVAAGSFAAGAAAVGLVRLRRGRVPGGVSWRPGSARRRRGATERLHIIGSRSLLLDVHLIGRPGK